MKKLTLENHGPYGAKVLHIDGNHATILSWMLLSKGELLPFPAVQTTDLATDNHLNMLAMCIQQLQPIDDDERLAASLLFMPMLEQSRRNTVHATP